MAGPLLIVQRDPKYGRVRRRGRFTVSREQAASSACLFKIISAMQEKLIRDMALLGFEYQDQFGFELQGPYEHITVSDDTSPDPGPMAGPHPLDLAAQETWEQEEKERAAKNVGAIADMVDYRIIGVFRHKELTSFRRSLGGA